MLWHPHRVPSSLLIAAILSFLVFGITCSATSQSTVARREPPSTQMLCFIPLRAILQSQVLSVGPLSPALDGTLDHRGFWLQALFGCVLVDAFSLAASVHWSVGSITRGWSEVSRSSLLAIGRGAVRIVYGQRQGWATSPTLNQLWLGLSSSPLSRFFSSSRARGARFAPGDPATGWLVFDVADGGATYRYAVWLSDNGTLRVRLLLSVEELTGDCNRGVRLDVIMTKPSTAIAAFLPLVLLALPPPPARRTIGDKPAAHRSHEEPCINPLDLDWDVPILSPEEMDWHEIDFGAYLTGFGRGEEIASLQKPQDSVPADELDPEFELWDVEILTAEEMAGLVGSFLADDEDEFFGDSSFESSSRVDRESWDVPILAPMEMGWLEFFEEEDFLHSPHCARHSEDDVLILSPEEMGWLDEDEETFLIRPVVTATENAEPKKAWFPPSPPLSPTAPMRDQVKTLKGTAEDMVAKRARQQPRLNTMLPSPPPSPTPLCQPQAEVRAGSGR